MCIRDRFEGTYNGNQLIDMYAHHRGKGDMNYDIWPPFSKLLNTQVQCNFAHKRMPEAHAFGWSGATPLFEVEVGGVNWKVGHKLEKLGGNLFDFLSWCAWDGNTYIPATRIDCSAIWAWTLANWESVIVPAATKAGVQFQPRLTIENLRSSYCDGIHAGSEVLGECDGTVIWDEFDIQIGDAPAKAKPADMPSHDSTKTEEPAATAAPQAGEKDSEKQSKVEARPNPCAACSGGNSVDVGIGKEEVVPGTEGYKGDFTFDDNGKVATVSNRWAKGVGDCLCVKGVASGKTVLRWGDGNSVEVNVG